MYNSLIETDFHSCHKMCLRAVSTGPTSTVLSVSITTPNPQAAAETAVVIRSMRLTDSFEACWFVSRSALHC